MSYVRGEISGQEIRVAEVLEKYEHGATEVLWRPKADCRPVRVGDVLRLVECNGPPPLAIPPSP